MVSRYRALYPEHAIAPTVPMPGAEDALRAVREAGGRTLVVTAKNGPHAELHFERLGIEPDASSAACGPRARRRPCAPTAPGCTWGTTPATSGAPPRRTPSRWPWRPALPAEELREAGADVVLTDLTDFRAWWEGYLA